jgi:polysaccharide chain length determinant protein (PEP-CTERM system associated)
MEKMMPTTGPVTEISLSAVAETLRRRRRHILAPTAVLTLLAALLAIALPSWYRARAHVAADPLLPQEFVSAKTDAPRVDPHEEERLQLRRMKEILLNRDALTGVATQFKLYPAPDGHVADKNLEAMRKRIQIESAADGDLYVTFEGRTRHEAMDVTNRLAQILVEQTSAVRDQQARQTSKVLEAELDGLRQKLTDQEQRINQYKAQAGLARPDQLETNLKLYQSLQEQLQHKSAALADEEAQRTALAQEVRDLERQGAAKSESKELQELRFKVKQAQGRYTEQHPERLALERQLREMESSRGSGSSGEASATYLRYVQAKSDLQAKTQRIAAYHNELDAVTAQLTAYQHRIESAPQHEGAMAALMRDYETTRTQYQEMLSKQHEAQLGYQLDRVASSIVFRVVEAATLPLDAASPHRARILLLGLLGGLGLGLVLAFVFEQSDTSIATLDDLQAFTSIPALAVIPRMETDHTIEKTGGKPGIALLANPRSILAEQYRILADRVREQAHKGRATVVVIASAVGGEGKSTVAINLALGLSRTTDGKVLLVDGDLRKPRIAQYLDIVPTRGFGHVLQRPEEDVQRYTWRLKDLYVLPGAGSVPDPVGLLSSDRATALFASLRRQFQTIVVDAPPVLPLADTPILARLADAAVFVVRAQRTPRELIERGVEGLDASKLVGIVLNDVDVQRSRYAAAYQYYEKCYLA